MNVTCPDCRTIYRVDPRKIPLGGVRARCSRCPGEFPVSEAGQQSDDVAYPPAELAARREDLSTLAPSAESAPGFPGGLGEEAAAERLEGYDPGDGTAARRRDDDWAGEDRHLAMDEPDRVTAFAAEVGRAGAEPVSEGRTSEVPAEDSTGADDSEQLSEQRFQQTGTWSSEEGSDSLRGSDGAPVDSEPLATLADTEPLPGFEEVPEVERETEDRGGATEPSLVPEYASEHEDPREGDSRFGAGYGGEVDREGFGRDPLRSSRGIDPGEDTLAIAREEAAEEPEDADAELHDPSEMASNRREGAVADAGHEEEPLEDETAPPQASSDVVAGVAESGQNDGEQDAQPEARPRTMATVADAEVADGAREGFAARPHRSDQELDLPPPPFGSSDPHQRARRLARALVSDIVVYNRDRRERSIQLGTVRQEFREEIRKSWEEYVAHVGNQMARETSYFRDALNDLLAGGNKLF